ncbi:sporulation protein YqfC [Defluviitalea raffinosedens]|uniref:Sporulation protein YqfC n=1 Tax=Defluviitalea raffinosedens TaxID=1450156 RepID=A0A7C8HI39_9FIRM|nr:sporulation protein YqfC [Defluviitalea raffinosedens]KAE9636974.1 sporulation protein YqfC [Defluviitalea raffinosedens]MBM7685274.1 sporulation protein YqfC [Defluviitalea raffinosedens]
MGRRKRKNKKEENIQPINLKKKVTDILELPKEVVLNLPMISMLGNEEMHIENYKGILEYDSERIKIYTSNGVLKLEGRGLSLKAMTTEEIVIKGTIFRIEFLI